MSRNPANLPGIAMASAIVARLSGAITRLDGSTPVPIYDGFPQDFTEWDYIGIGGMTAAETDVSGTYDVTVSLQVFSTYNGYREASTELNQIHRSLTTPLDMAADGFSDVSQGGLLASPVEWSKRRTEEGLIVTLGTYRRRWTVCDDKF